MAEQGKRDGAGAAWPDRPDAGRRPGPGICPTPAAALGPETARRRAGLVSAQLLGLGLIRYLLRLPAVTALTRGETEDGLAPAIEALLAAK
ncbi:TetR/AcrR family transcriptional regulator [Streptomyces sp. 3214.6]|uniref:TetR/AcrR family transcriptional regulator n=1 Tax=Streptomyces sp. 3214.6 TaxID=1882757 RepID=UPI00090BAE6A|nr:hypothetical protein [Streptomyces sp. 3214.6]SHI08727.1 hypothetical protein SAMN05444521_3810 [Streptomyces sp. 3214.6]